MVHFCHLFLLQIESGAMREQLRSRIIKLVLYFLVCTTLGVTCECQVQGSDSCDLIESSECDWATKQCKCSAGFEEDDGECRDLFDFFSDGASLGGFYNSPGSSGIWTPTEGSDADEYDIDTNNKYLLASGYVRLLITESCLLSTG